MKTSIFAFIRILPFIKDTGGSPWNEGIVILTGNEVDQKINKTYKRKLNMLKNKEINLVFLFSHLEHKWNEKRHLPLNDK